MRNSRADLSDLDLIARDVANLKNDLGKLVTHAKSDASEAVNTETRRLYHSVAGGGRRSVAALSQRVEDRPLASLLIAFAVGFVGSQFLRR